MQRNPRSNFTQWTYQCIYPRTSSFYLRLSSASLDYNDQPSLRSTLKSFVYSSWWDSCKTPSMDEPSHRYAFSKSTPPRAECCWYKHHHTTGEMVFLSIHDYQPQTGPQHYLQFSSLQQLLHSLLSAVPPVVWLNATFSVKPQISSCPSPSTSLFPFRVPVTIFMCVYSFICILCLPYYTSFTSVLITRHTQRLANSKISIHIC